MCTSSLTCSTLKIHHCRRKLLSETFNLIIMLGGLFLFGANALAENSYKIESQDNDLMESQIEGKHVGQDPFAFTTAEQMYKSGAEKRYDGSAGKYIETIKNTFPNNYQDEGKEGFYALLQLLQPYRKSDQVQNAIGQWAKLYLTVIQKGSSTSFKKIIASGLKKFGFDDSGMFEQGNILYIKGDFAGASVQYRKALSESPQNLDVRCNLALAQLHLGHDLVAQFELEFLRSLKPDYLPAQINLSVVLERLNRTKEARKIALEVSHQKKDVAIAAFNAAWFHSLDGQYEKAVNALKPFSEIDVIPKFSSFYKTNEDLLKHYGKVHKAAKKTNKNQEHQNDNKVKTQKKNIVTDKTIKSNKKNRQLTADDIYKKAREYHFESEKKEYKKAMEWYLKAAKSGHAKSMNSIGTMYEYGEGVPQDYLKAAEWYHRSADKGYAAAMYNLGVMYSQGNGVQQDNAQAIKWYRQAANKGDSDAMNNLGVIYETGQGVTVSPGGAVKWYRLGADKGHPEAMSNLGRLYENGAGVEENTTKAILWYEKAAAKGSSSAMNNLGLINESRNNDKIAVQWYRKATKKGHAGALANLGYCYETGRGVAQDLTKAVKYYRNAANQGNRFAKDALIRLE